VRDSIVVLESTLTGQANKAIAYDLGISENTVETHRTRIIQKIHTALFENLADPA
jgi:FixJ family two-component response regulator